MGAVSKFMALLSPPIPAVRPSIALLNRRLSSIPASPFRPLNVSSPSKTRGRACQIANSFHSQPSNSSYALNSAVATGEKHPWPEWTHFLGNLLNGQAAPEDYRIHPEDAFVVYEKLPEDFVRAAASCIAFSRARPDLLGLLSRRDVEAVISNGTPFLFKSALDTARRMRAFLGTDDINGADFGAASTVDLMKYILSYASNATLPSERNGLYSREVVDSSVQNLLRQLVTVSSGVSGGNMAAPGQQFSCRDEQTLRPSGQNIQMKRGDWICTKCNFMNFARNMKCLECEESRPRNMLSGREWECPECSFFNNGRNTICLRCDRRKPGTPLLNNSDSYQTSEPNRGTGFSRPSFQTVTSDFQHGSSSSNSRSVSDTFYSQHQSAAMTEHQEDSASRMDSQNQENEQAAKSERWFKKIAELHNVKDLPSAVSDEDFPEIMPMRKGENRFVVSKKKDRSNRHVAMDQANNGNSVPFVPFPPGYFSRKDTDQPTAQDSNTAFIRENPSNTVKPDNSEVSNTNIGHRSEALRVGSQPFSSGLQGTTYQSASSDSWTNGDSAFSSESTAASIGASSQAPESDNARSDVKETVPIDMSEEAKAERWFKRVAQIKDISELSQIPDEDFPSIMPMRKGVNRFVVSKRKTPLERRLTSQQHRRNLPVVTNDSWKKESDST